jgi:P27 family predicted phage terminase small subunit
MKRGTKPTPTALKVLRGNPGKRKLPENEPQPKGKLPAAPSCLDQAARAAWKRLAAMLGPLGLATAHEREALASYCSAWSSFCRAENELKKKPYIDANGKAAGGYVIEAANGTLMPSPWLAIRETAMRNLLKFGVEFGLTPSARTRVAATPATKTTPTLVGKARFFKEPG